MEIRWRKKSTPRIDQKALADLKFDIFFGNETGCICLRFLQRVEGKRIQLDFEWIRRIWRVGDLTSLLEITRMQLDIEWLWRVGDNISSGGKPSPKL